MSLESSSIFSKPSSEEKNKLILYHGTTEIDLEPSFGGGKSTHDYGNGFYCTADFHQAELWACASNGSGYVHSYEIDLEGLNVLTLSSDDAKLWLSILMKHRTPNLNDDLSYHKEFMEKYLTVDVNDYDFIIGYRTDDSYFAIVEAFCYDFLTYDDLTKSLNMGELGFQYVLKSDRAYNRLKKLSTYKTQSEELYKEFWDRDKKYRDSFKEIRKDSKKKRKDKIKYKTITDLI